MAKTRHRPRDSDFPALPGLPTCGAGGRAGRRAFSSYFLLLFLVIFVKGNDRGNSRGRSAPVLAQTASRDQGVDLPWGQCLG